MGISLEMYFLSLHLDNFPENFGAVINEKGERFNNDLKLCENSLRQMLGDYIWSILRETDKENYKKSKINHL